MPGLWARSLVWGSWEASTCWCFSPSFSLLCPLSKNKLINFFKKEELPLSPSRGSQFEWPVISYLSQNLCAIHCHLFNFLTPLLDTKCYKGQGLWQGLWPYRPLFNSLTQCLAGNRHLVTMQNKGIKQLWKIITTSANPKVFFFQNCHPLPGPVWLSWLEHRPTHQKVVGSTPHQGTRLGSWFNPQSGNLWEVAHQCFSVTLMFLFPLFSPFLSS